MAHASTSAEGMRKHSLPDDDSYSTQYESNLSPKRQRVDSDGYAFTPTPSPPPVSRQKGKGVQHHEDGDDSDDSDLVEMRDQPGPSRKGKEKERAPSDVAEHGIILEVNLTNFMSHKLTTVEFGPQMNFLIGNNGSGKSAILTAITMALGGAVKASNRGKKGCDLVRDQAPYAVCSVKLKNEGAEAFQPATYGASITIERRINADAGGGYQIKDETGRTVDRRKSTVDRILEAFNIQVSNPLIVLTQDESKDFIAKSTEVEKYKLFLRGSQLHALSENYQKILFNLKILSIAIERKHDLLQELEADFDAADQKAESATAVREQVQRKKRLQEKVAWAHVVEAEERLEEGHNMYDAETSKDAEIDDDLRQATDERDQASLDVESLQATAAAAEQDNKEAEIAAVVAESKEHIDQLRAKNRDVIECKRKEGEFSSTLAEVEKEIEAAKRDRGGGLDRQPVLDELDGLGQKLLKIASDADRTKQQSQDATAEQESALADESRAKDDVRTAQTKVDKIKSRIADLQKTTSNKLHAYGYGAVRLAQLVGQERGWTAPVVGPVGECIGVRDSRYAQVLETVLGGSLGTWLVGNRQDRDLFNRLRKEARSNASVAIWNLDPTFNFKGGEPADDILTMARALDFTSKPNGKLAQQYLIVDSRIESAALVPERRLGDVLMRSNPRNVSAAYSPDCFKLSGSSAGMTTTALTQFKGSPRLTSDISQQLNSTRVELSAAELEVSHLQDSLREVRQHLDRIKTKGKGFDTEMSMNYQQRKKVEARRRALEAQLEAEEPTNLDALEDLRQSTISDRAGLRAQAAVLEQSKADVAAKLVPLTRRKEELATAQKANRDLLRRLERKTDEKERDLAQADRRLKAAERAKTAHEQAVADLATELKERQATFQARESEAVEVCEQRPAVAQKKSAAALNLEIAALEKAIRDYSREAGQTPEEVVAQRDRLKKTRDTARSICRTLDDLQEVFLRAYAMRTEKWFDFRGKLASRAKLSFPLLLSTRGFLGKMRIIHEGIASYEDERPAHLSDLPEDFHDARTHGKLKLDVVPDAVSGSLANAKELASLSGGEKSFGTTAMLLSQWADIEAPFHCLDEFDVFMDPINRRLSMRLIMDAAEKSASKQYILITPQSVTEGGTRWGENVRIVRLADPERSQGSLAAGA